MPIQHYSKLYRLVHADALLQLQVLVLFLTTYIDWVLMPYVTKLEGTLLPIFMISFFMLVSASDGLIQPLFKKVRLYRVYMFTILLDIIQISSYALYQYDVVIFTYVILSLFTLQSITFEISRIHTIDFMKDHIAVKDYLILRSFVLSVAIIGGALTAMFMDALKVDLFYILLGLGILGMIAIIITYRLYNFFKKTDSKRRVIVAHSKRMFSE